MGGGSGVPAVFMGEIPTVLPGAVFLGVAQEIHATYSYVVFDPESRSCLFSISMS